MKRFSKFGMIVLAFLLAVPAFAADNVIYNGIDLWHTRGDGSTRVDFSRQPLPAGFFCFKSEPFSGQIVFQGVPVATNIPGALGKADTVIQRLDDAAFNKRGVALTRLQVRAMNFVSVSPVKTACGSFIATVSLDGEQPITRMRIIRDDDKGGRFVAPISVNVKISFMPVGRAMTEPLEIRKSLRFPPAKNQTWESLATPSSSKATGFLLVDTDGDRRPDTYLPGTSNFGVGLTRMSKVPIDCAEHFSAEDGCWHYVC